MPTDQKTIKKIVKESFPSAIAARAYLASDGYDGWRIMARDLHDYKEIGYSQSGSAEAAWRNAYWTQDLGPDEYGQRFKRIIK